MAKKHDKKHIIEALIFASDLPLPAKRIRDVLPDVTEGKTKKMVAELNESYEKNSLAIKIIEVAGGFQMVSRSEYAGYISKMLTTRASSRLTRRALETLAIIAYKQPITKAEMEAIRGVNVDGVVKTLIERNLITVTGREKAPGNPLLYGTTSYFLEYFGLRDITDLPKLKEIDELLKGDEKFLESLDQVALEQLNPEELGLTSMLKGKKQDSPEKVEDQEKEEVAPSPGNAGTNTEDQTEQEEIKKNDAAE